MNYYYYYYTTTEVFPSLLKENYIHATKTLKKWTARKQKLKEKFFFVKWTAYKK